MCKTTQAPTVKWLSTRVLIGFSVLALGGCSSTRSITNFEPVAKGASYQAEYRSRLNSHARIIPASEQMNASKCTRQALITSDVPQLDQAELLTPGDLVDVSIGNDEVFNGKYEISGDGKLKLKDLVSVQAYGKTAPEVEASISKALVAGKYYRVVPVVSVRLADYGAARTFVSGAVFEPGAVIVGGSAASNNDNSRVLALGAATEGRRLSRALQNAGGVRPDADLSRVELRRGAKHMVIDLRPAIIGGAFDDPVVLEGDQVTVPSRGCFQQALMVPSAISPVGVKVFMSNLTEPAYSNANSAINKDTREMRYGTRMLQTIVSMNCVGGSNLTNASRSAVLYSRNPETGKSIVIERKIEDLVRNADRDDYDPFILPNDALACYDSGTTDVVKLAQSFGVVAGAVVLGRGL